jgi:hypothetical protein
VDREQRDDDRLLRNGTRCRQDEEFDDNHPDMMGLSFATKSLNAPSGALAAASGQPDQRRNIRYAGFSVSFSYG